MLLGTLSAEMPEAQPAGKQQTGLVAKLEEALAALQELPEEEMTSEQQDILYALVQLLSQQKTQLEGTVPASEAGTPKHLPVAESLQAANTPDNEKLIALIKQLSESLKENSSVNIQFEQSIGDMGVTEKKPLINQEKTEQVIQKLLALVEELEKLQQSTAAKPVLFQTMERLQQVIPKSFINKEEAPEKVSAVDAQQNSDLETEVAKAPLAQTTASALTGDGDASPQENAEQPDQSQRIVIQQAGTEQEEPVLPGENKLAAAESVKAGQTQTVPKAEPAPPVPTVRMANLTEELGEIFRSSMRMAATPEGTQIRVNITPEHLGHLDIRLTETNGKIAAQIFTSSLMAKEALDLQVNQLRNTLIQQGIAVEKIEVTQQSSQQQSLNQQNAHPEQSFAQQQKQGSASGTRNAYLRGEEEAVAERAPQAEGLMKVDYTV